MLPWHAKSVNLQYSAIIKKIWASNFESLPPAPCKVAREDGLNVLAPSEKGEGHDEVPGLRRDGPWAGKSWN